MTMSLMLATLTLIGQGQRPYEMVWAGRTEDAHPPLVAFDDVTGWSVECDSAVATIERSQEQLLFADAVTKLIYRAEGRGNPVVRIMPPAPIDAPASFDCVTFWIYGNNWGFAPDPSTPPVGVWVVFGSPGGPDVVVDMTAVRWVEWWVMHRKLTAEQIEALGDQPQLRRIEIVGGRNRDDRTIYLANLAAFEEEFGPLQFDPRPRRNLEPFPGQGTGTNTGPGTLPFPTREQTILPGPLDATDPIAPRQDGERYVFEQAGDEGFAWVYAPESGTLSDVTYTEPGREAIRPLDGGGVQPPDGASPTGAPDLLECGVDGDGVRARWRLTFGEVTLEPEYVFRVWGRSLVIDVLCPGGVVGRVTPGAAAGPGVVDPRLTTLPYLTYGSTRPAVLTVGSVDAPLFLSAMPDYYRSNASELAADNLIREDGHVRYGGIALYTPRTDGVRNDCFERLFVTAAPRFEDVLPNIANPRSPWFDVMGARLWIAHGAWDREKDYAHWAQRARLGMDKIVITDHETGWRDGGESFTLRTRTAPGRGGDESQAWYAKAIQDLGYVYGIYNNYTDFASVNEFWSEDYVARMPDGQLRPAWPRCYHLKPARAVELEAMLSPIIEEKFHLSTAYCDVHTAVQPWHYTDFDARVPGAGTFASTFYAYGEIMLHQKATWDGPVYSEGNSHWYWVGLTDGNYGQDQGGKLPSSPWLVDFDLLKMHPLGVGFGMGAPNMFYPYSEGLGAVEQRVERLDRFLAATVAFGHTGFYVQDLGIPGAARSYFMLQQLASHYAAEQAESIRYADAAGHLLTTSQAVATGAYRRSQVRTTYENGLTTIVNGEPEDTLTCAVDARVLQALAHGPEVGDTLDLAPNGYLGYLLGGDEVILAVLSNETDGRRVDYADTPEYVFIDGRGSFVRFPKAAADGSFAAIYDGNGGAEVIPYVEGEAMAVSMGGMAAQAEALDFDRQVIGPAETRLCRGLVSILPVEGAVSYRLTPVAAPEVSLACERETVVPGERVVVRGEEDHEVTIPGDAVPGTRHFVGLEGAWIDFTIAPLVDTRLELPSLGEREEAGATWRLALRSHQPAASTVAVTLGDAAAEAALQPGLWENVELPFQEPQDELVLELPLAVTTDGAEHRESWWLKAERGVWEVVEIPSHFDAGERPRGEEERPTSGRTGAYAVEQRMSCGGLERAGIFMHPPWQGGVGYTYALLGPVKLPDLPHAVFRCWVGKQDGSDPGDGILFRVGVVDEGGVETMIAEQVVAAHEWLPLEGDLAPWAGRTVRLKLIGDVGVDDNSSGDWACFADMRIETRGPELGLSLHREPVELKHAPGPHALDGITLEELRAARRGWVTYQASGLESRPPYVSELVVNEVNIGRMPSGTGVEAEWTWGDDVQVDLTPEAIAALDASTELRINNTGQDFFKVRRFCIVVELADGRLFSSDIHTVAYTQPSTWPYVEGVAVPFGTPITLDVRFGLEGDERER